MQLDHFKVSEVLFQGVELGNTLLWTIYFMKGITFGQQLRMVCFDWISPKDTCVKLLAFSVVALRGAIDIYGVIRPYRMCSLRVCEVCPPGSKYESLAGTDTITLYQRTRCDHLLAHTPTISLHMGPSSLGLERPQRGGGNNPRASW